MGEEIQPPPRYAPIGPFVNRYQLLRITRVDLAIASAAFALASVFAVSAAFIAVRQSRACRRPLKSGYVWMIWLEWLACVAISIECLLYLLRFIRPSFYFFMSLLFWWTIQTQLLLQVIINRIRIILHDKTRGHQLVIGTAVFVGLINISVFIIWIPARLQISDNWIRINTVWDRIEKILYLFIDGFLNYYFIRVVKANLVQNGLSKYNRLVRFNQRIMIISLLMDVMIVGAMSVPNGLVYAMFHPLAYLVKLNIEMSMAHLIKMIALGSPNNDNISFLLSSGSTSQGLKSGSSGMFAESQDQRQSLFCGLFGRTLDRSSVPMPTKPITAVTKDKCPLDVYRTVSRCGGDPCAAGRARRMAHCAHGDDIRIGGLGAVSPSLTNHITAG